MSKIRELESVLGSGARNNKYRVIFPYMGREIDIQVHDVNAPGRSMGVSEIFIKGRKYQLAGDRSDEGTFSMTFYNDPDMFLRGVFLKMISGIENYDVPASMGGSPQKFRVVGGSILAPWYQTDIRIQQLDHNEMVSFDSIYHNAFPTEIGPIEYQDETGDISTTSLTISYTSATYM